MTSDKLFLLNRLGNVDAFLQIVLRHVVLRHFPGENAFL